MAFDEKAERGKMLDYVSKRMNKAADKMIEASKRVNSSQDETTKTVWLKKYVKHRMSYLWYKRLLEDNLEAIDSMVKDDISSKIVEDRNA